MGWIARHGDWSNKALWNFSFPHPHMKRALFSGFKHIAPLLAFLSCMTANAENGLPMMASDPHYTPIGFFDVHVCNWTDRKPFYMVVFSTKTPDAISSIQFHDAHGKLIGPLDMKRYQSSQGPGQPEKRVFITHFPIPPHAQDGWVSATIKTRDGQEYLAKDFVVHTVLPIATELEPASEADLDDVPKELRWKAIPGATHYVITIRDEWDEEKLVYRSPPLTAPRLAIPAGLLKRGGRYQWIVHARDVNGSILLGDFNHGSLSAPAYFTITP